MMETGRFPLEASMVPLGVLGVIGICEVPRRDICPTHFAPADKCITCAPGIVVSAVLHTGREGLLL
jgi:hypothetical protein